MRDPNPQVAGRGLRALRKGGVSTRVGVLEGDCSQLIRGFAQWVVHARPWVHVKMAASLDGRIAAAGGASKWISSSASRDLVQEMRRRCDAILVGVGTVLADDPRLNCRVDTTRVPLRVVLDSRLRTPPRARVVTGKGPVLIVASAEVPVRARRRLEAAGAEVISVRDSGRRGWSVLLRELGRRNVMELLVEGGEKVVTSALQARVVNAMTIFYNPRLIGADGVPLVGPLGVRQPRRAMRFRTTSWSTSGPDFVWTGVPE
jgi:diaminohydroxyphosphoribosylaminopyrimidine deaminase/5-amino-6-(5-phosphoribosylamino)uracil reductase